jgi:uncharacterized protein YjbI with pentapeptide repeats
VVRRNRSETMDASENATDFRTKPGARDDAPGGVNRAAPAAEETRSRQLRSDKLLALLAAGTRDFGGIEVSSADLRNANLHGVNFCDSILQDAALAYANLGGANLVGADLRRSDLRWTNLGGANLSYARLAGTNFAHADLSQACMIGADLTEADMSYAELCGAHLGGANLRRAKLIGSHLRDAHLDDADFGGAILADTELLGIDLSPLCGASPPLTHRGPSQVDHVALIRSIRSPKLQEFLQRAGMPEVFIEYNISCAMSLQSSAFKLFRSTFISYGSPDEPFARTLYEALHRNGITTYFFPEHAIPGQKLHRTMRNGINEHDRVILVCSRASLDRKGVLNEIEETLQREARDGGASFLIPIRLDDYVLAEWDPPNRDTAQAVRDRVVADFEGADEDEAKFQSGLRRLIAALRK